MTKADRERQRLEHDEWAAGLGLGDVSALLAQRSVTNVALKLLPQRQDNDKNQFYFGTDLTSGGATFIPSRNLTGTITSSSKPGAAGKTLFQADVNFQWIGRDADYAAPNAKLIFYPQYPEARLSGLIKGCANPPRTLYVRALGAQVPGRVLVLGTTDDERTYGLLLPPDSPAARSFVEIAPTLQRFGVLHLWRLHGNRPFSASQLAAELHGVHLRHWVPGCRLTGAGVVPFFARPAGGATLEAHLGVLTNSDSMPDFQGWELKQHSGNILTLFTSEPDGGLYRSDFFTFMRRYGVDNGRRYNFTGIQRVGADYHKNNGLRLTLMGYRTEEDYDPQGRLALVDKDGRVAASWSFLKLLDHWMAKHARAAYVPSEKNDELKAYRFGKDVRMAQGAAFRHLLRAIAEGKVYYDPACRTAFTPNGASIPAETKRRNQWRVHVRDLDALYGSLLPTDVTTIPADNTISQRALAALGVTLPTLGD